jgi:hypothetical protein
MGIYSFKSRFVDKVLSGEKTHIVRAIRGHPDKPGNTLHLYTGLRRKGARLLMRATCTKVQKIELRATSVWIDGELMFSDECELLARRDGFENFEEMWQFWEDRLPFEGYIIHWRHDAHNAK